MTPMMPLVQLDLSLDPHHVITDSQTYQCLGPLA